MKAGCEGLPDWKDTSNSANATTTVSDNHQTTGGFQKKFQRQNTRCLEWLRLGVLEDPQFRLEDLPEEATKRTNEENKHIHAQLAV